MCKAHYVLLLTIGLAQAKIDNYKLLGEEMKQGSKQWKKVVAGLKSEPPHRARPLPTVHTTLTLRARAQPSSLWPT